MIDWNEGAMDHEPVYRLQICEMNRVLRTHENPDPFHNTTIHVRGWRNALRVLLRRYHVVVWQTADHDVVERVCELSPDYLGAHGSARRERWNAHLQGALGDFAERSDA